MVGGYNLWGLGGLFAALLALLLYGISLGKKDGVNKASKAEAEKKSAELQNAALKASSKASVQTAKTQEKEKASYKTGIQALEKAKEENDLKKASEIASQSAKKAIGKGAVGK